MSDEPQSDTPAEQNPADIPAETTPPRPAPSGDYGSHTIRVLKGIEGIRTRPAMYIGDTDQRGLHHLIFEVVDNSIDEAMAGHCKHITVRLNMDGSVTIADDGRGIPADIHPVEKVSTLQVVLTNLHSGGKFEKKAYQVSGGLHGVGITAVNALAEWLRAEVRRDGKKYVLECEHGVPQGTVRDSGEARDTGTKITFKPDPSIFKETKFKYSILEGRLRDLAYLNPGLHIELSDEESGVTEKFFSAEGIVEFVRHLNRNETVLHPDVIMIQGTKEVPVGDSTGIVDLQVAMQYNTAYSETILAFCNNINNIDHGVHVSGFRNALTRTLNNYGKANNLFKGNDKTLNGEDFREGLTAIVNIRVPDPQFGGQTKTKLNNPEIEGIVNNIVGEQLGQFLEENPKLGRKIIDKAVLAAEAREASRKARELARQRKGALFSDSLPGKLFDCIENDARICELFLVEGDSAGGTAVNGRDRNIQAILPLKGKILNVEKARVDRVLANEEIVNIIRAVGVGVGMEIDLDKRNYEKVVIMTDADVDGSHIRTLLLTFFYRQMPMLVQEGHVFIAQPPLYQVKSKRGEARYVRTEEEMRGEFLRLGMQGMHLALADDVTIDGENLGGLVDILSTLENALQALERRGFNLRDFLRLRDEKTGALPMYQVRKGAHVRWFVSPTDADAYLESLIPAIASEATAGETDDADAVAGQTPQPPAEAEAPGEEEQDRPQLLELHEVRAINRSLEALQRFGFGPDDLLPVERRPGEEPAPRYFLANGKQEREPIATLRELVLMLRKNGEKMLEVKRFKGLGEMNDEELWNTTMDPSRRVLSRVTVENAAVADEMFRVLMGEHVEPRREFIERHALEVRNLDYHA